MPIREWFIILSRFCLKALSNQLTNQWIGSRISLNDSFSSLPHTLTESSEAVHSDNIKSDEDVALDLQSIESKSAKACLLELYEDLLLDEHCVCGLLFHRYRPRYHYDIITSLLYMYLIH